jgi:hypothetical protein
MPRLRRGIPPSGFAPLLEQKDEPLLTPTLGRGGEGKGAREKRNSRPALAFSPPQFSVFRLPKCATICKLIDFVCKINKIIKPVSFVIFQNFRYSSARFKQ